MQSRAVNGGAPELAVQRWSDGVERERQMRRRLGRVAGAAIGALAGGGKGAAIGAIAGGGSGLAYDRMTAKKRQRVE